MEEQKLSLNQNLSGARIFLNLFDLVLEPVNDLCESSRIGVFDKNNNRVGEVFFEDGSVKIVCKTSIGTLMSDYKFEKFDGFNDIECGGFFANWRHDINFEVVGNQNFKGNMLVDIVMDTGYGNHCRLHTHINYVDREGKNVKIVFMEDGKPFKYEATQDDFSEWLDIDPYDDFESYLYHHIRMGGYDKKHHDFPNEYVRFVWHNGADDRQHLRTILETTENFERKEFDKKTYDRIGKEDSPESAIQKGSLMQKIDPKFAEKITELIELLRSGDVSFFENLISAVFHNESDEVIRALFGRNIKKINYYNDVDNLEDAYFGVGENNIFLPRDVYRKALIRDMFNPFKNEESEL